MILKEKEKLLPCRICGEKPELLSYRTYSEKIHGMVVKYYVECICGAEIPELGYEDKERAIDEWNEVNNG